VKETGILISAGTVGDAVRISFIRRWSEHGGGDGGEPVRSSPGWSVKMPSRLGCLMGDKQRSGLPAGWMLQTFCREEKELYYDCHLKENSHTRRFAIKG